MSVYISANAPFFLRNNEMLAMQPACVSWRLPQHVGSFSVELLTCVFFMWLIKVSQKMYDAWAARKEDVNKYSYLVSRLLLCSINDTWYMRTYRYQTINIDFLFLLQCERWLLFNVKFSHYLLTDWFRKFFNVCYKVLLVFTSEINKSWAKQNLAACVAPLLSYSRHIVWCI